MSSILRVNTLQNSNTSNIITQTNATTLTIGASGQTISIPAGATLNTTTINVTTLVLAAGVVGTPSLTTSGDTNTGIFFPAADTIAFTEGGTEAMRINDSGKVLIGITANPDGKFIVNNGTDKNVQIRGSIRLAGSSIQSVQSNITNDSPLEIYTGGSQLQLEANPISFYNGGERMRITSDGTLLIGYTSQPTNGGLLSVNGSIAAGGGYKTKAGVAAGIGANIFNIEWTGSAQLWIDTTNIGTFTFTSDYRIKRNIETQTAPALNRIMALRPVTFQMADYGTLFKASDDIKEGFIAHEVQEVIPSGAEGVKDAENQIQSLRVDAILAVTVKAIQEQQAIIEELKATSNSQKTKIDALEARLTALES